jgi:hypothetical protein
MPRPVGYVTISVPLEVHDRLVAHRAHPRQAIHQVITRSIDHWDATHAVAGAYVVRAGVPDISWEVGPVSG